MIAVESWDQICPIRMKGRSSTFATAPPVISASFIAPQLVPSVPTWKM